MRECSCGMLMFHLLCIQTCVGIPVVEWQWGEAFPFQYPPSRSWIQRVQLRVSQLALTIWCQLYCGLAIFCYHRDMESSRTFCCKTIRVQPYLRETEKPPVGNVQGISTFVIFHHWLSEYYGVDHQMVPYKTDGCLFHDKANLRQSFQASKRLHYGESLQ